MNKAADEQILYILLKQSVEHIVIDQNTLAMLANNARGRMDQFHRLDDGRLTFVVFPRKQRACVALTGERDLILTKRAELSNRQGSNAHPVSLCEFLPEGAPPG